MTIVYIFLYSLVSVIHITSQLQGSMLIKLVLLVSFIM